MTDRPKTLFQLSLPLCLETLCYMLAGMLDTLMLSSVSDRAVGAVGTANSYIGVFIIMFSILSSGMIAVMTQYIGAGRRGIAYQARQLGLAFNAVLGVFLSLFLAVYTGPVLKVMGVAEILEEYTGTYLRIVGGGCFLNAMIPIFSSYLRAFGYTKQPLMGTLAGNAVNVILNALFLFVFNMGVAGVAAATVISKAVNLLLLMEASHRLVNVETEEDRLPNGQVLGKIVRIGFPAAAETALYNLAMMVITRFLNQMDAQGIHVTARSYAAQITNLAYCVSAGLAQANAILTGWRIGEGDFDACARGTRKAAAAGIGISVALESLFALNAGVIMRLFTDDPVMIRLVGTLLAVDIVLEIGRASNMVFGTALKTSGDAVFPSVIGAVFMYVCAVGGTWFFGIHLRLMVVGAYIGMTLDECIRALCMFLRWQSGKWKEMRLVNRIQE